MNTKLEIKVIPKSSRSEIIIDGSGTIKVYLTTPPVDGKANSECIKLIAKKLHTARSNVTIIKGHVSRQKVVEIKNFDHDDIMTLLKN